MVFCRNYTSGKFFPPISTQGLSLPQDLIPSYSNWRSGQIGRKDLPVGLVVLAVLADVVVVLAAAVVADAAASAVASAAVAVAVVPDASDDSDRTDVDP